MSDGVPGLNFADRVQELLGRVTCCRATSAAERNAIFQMRYDCYLREGAIDENETKLFADVYDNEKNAILLGVFVDGVLSSSLRIHSGMDASARLPDKGAFADVIEPMMASGMTVIDISRFVVAYEASRAYPNLAYATVRVGWLGGEFFGVDRILTATRLEHVPFYRRLFAVDVLTEPRAYPTLKKPVALLAVDQREKRERVHRRYPFFASTAAERQKIFGVPDDQRSVDASAWPPKGESVAKAGDRCL